MAEANDTAGMIYQNLIDAGCDKQTTEKCMSAIKNEVIRKCFPYSHNTEQLCLAQCALGRSKLTALIA